MGLERKVIIPLSDKTRIRGTNLAWQLESLKSDGEWRATKYYQSFGVALREAAQREIRTFPATGITEALAACEAVTAKFANIFDNVGSRVTVIQDTDLMANDQLAEPEALEAQS